MKTLNKNHIIILILSISLLILTFVNIYKYYLINKTKQQKYNEQNLNKTNYDSQLERIKNKKISFINETFDSINFQKTSISFLLIYQESDCAPCITLSKNLSFSFKKNNILTIYLSDKENDPFLNTKYKKKEEDINFYLKKIKYIKTPVILKFDSTFKVLDAFFPTVHKDEEFDEFIER